MFALFVRQAIFQLI